MSDIARYNSADVIQQLRKSWLEAKFIVTARPDQEKPVHDDIDGNAALPRTPCKQSGCVCSPKLRNYKACVEVFKT